MGKYRTSFSDIVRYTLRDSLGNLEISEPIGWEEDEKEFKRSTDVHGVFINLSNNLEFPRGDEYNNGGYDRLRQIYELEGINAVVLLIKEEKFNGVWEESYRGYLDFSTFSRQNNIAKIKFNESGLYEKIKARQSEKIELERTTTLDDAETQIEPLVKQTANLDGRAILIVSQFNKTTSKTDLRIASGDNIVNLESEYNYLTFDHNKGRFNEAIAVPISMVTEIDGNAASVQEYDIKENGSSYENGSTTATMFYDADNDVKLKIELNIELECISNSAGNGGIRLDLVKYSGGTNYVFDSYQTLAYTTTIEGTFLVCQIAELEVDVLSGDSLAIAVHSTSPPGTGLVVLKTHIADVIIKDPTYYEASTADFVFPHEALERTLHIITNEELVLKSNLLSRKDLLDSNGIRRYNLEDDGFAGLIGLTSGFLVRKFTDKEMTTSFKDFVKSYGAIAQAGYGIEKFGFKEQLRFEKIDHFYQNEVTIKIGQPNDIKRTVASDYFYSSLELGYDKPSGDNLYEEAMGLDEYNIQGNYITPITRVENKFEKKSKFRADSYGKEFARRKPKSLFPEDDTRYDKDLMLMDLKRNADGLSNYKERLWLDDFESPSEFSTFATGVYSPETATNLRLSPLNCLLRWGFWIKGGLEKYKEKSIRYISTEGNSSLTTQIKGSDKIYSENGEVLIDDLDKNIFIPEYIEFEYPVDGELLRTINSTSINVDGDKIMNYYGLVEFVNEDGKYEYGFLMSLKPNKQGQWKLLKANKKALRRNFIETPLPKPPKPTESGFNYELNHEID